MTLIGIRAVPESPHSMWHSRPRGFTGRSACATRMNEGHLLVFMIAILAVTIFPATARASEPWSVKWEPAQLVNGSPVLFRITAPVELTTLEGAWLGHTLSFRFGQSCNCWYAIAGVDLNTKAGKYSLVLQGKGKPGVKTSFTSTVAVSEKPYPSTSIKVAPEYVAPPAETEARIEEEQALKKRVFSVIAPESLWSGRFQATAEAKVSGVFGSSRLCN